MVLEIGCALVAAIPFAIKTTKSGLVAAIPFAMKTTKNLVGEILCLSLPAQNNMLLSIAF